MPVRADAVAESLPGSHYKPRKQRRPQADDVQHSRATKDPSREIENQYRGMEYEEHNVQRSKHVCNPDMRRFIIIILLIILIDSRGIDIVGLQLLRRNAASVRISGRCRRDFVQAVTQFTIREVF